jgi:hypothetical protein
MVLTEAERNARRQAGVNAMTVVERIRRDLMGGRPPASELKTSTSALIAAKTLFRELGMRISGEACGMALTPRMFAVSVGYVSPDLSVLGFTPVLMGYTPTIGPGEEASIERTLTGNVPIGLLFGILDDDKKFLMGVRPFMATKQTDAWLSELTLPVRSEFDITALIRSK